MTIKKILVVDDSATERHVLGGVLGKQGFEVFYAEDGEKGVEQARQNKPDLIIMDVVMPGMNGFQATRAISRDPETKHIPIIVCTTKNQETDKVWGLRQGAKDYVVKPIVAAELLSKIAALG
ncbi:MAG: twitching motility two-component system response regulator PilH [Gallionellaceae bacterium]|nr:MAG: twitching motility two-component system response regulator PilH [Gallionellaceae bacterium]